MQTTHLASEELVVSFFGVLRNLKRISPADRVDKPSLMVLHALSTGEPMRLSDAAAAVCLDLSTVSRHVRALEDAGYVRRTEDPNDGRASLLALTDDGREVLAYSFEVRRTAIGNAIAGWSEPDRQTLTHLLTRLASDLAPRQAAQALTES